MSGTLHIPDVDGQTVAVLGLGRTGAATVAALAASGATVWAWDDAEAGRNAVAPEHRVSLADADWSKPKLLVMSPGIPQRHPAPHPVAALARRSGCPIVSDIELLTRAQPKSRFVAVTGTNGKSTVTTLIGHILRSAGRSVAVGGNLGQAALSLPALSTEGIYVLEVSSYQIEITPSAFADIAVLLNITPDHLDRHGGMDGYIAVKKSVMRPKGAGSLGVIGVDDDYCRAIYEDLRASARRLVPISAERRLDGGVHAADGMLVDSVTGADVPVIDLKSVPTLPGRHNWQNAAAAYVATRALGLSIDEIAKGLSSYPGLAHRQELVGQIGRVRYVNDSKATNADAAAKALACYDGIYWIAGGKPKEGGLGGLEDYYPRIRRAYLIGEAADAFATQLGSGVAHRKCGTLDRAVAEAHRDAQTDAEPSTVLLSPACASFDQFPNFEVRGDTFRKLVHALPPIEAGARA